MDEPHTADRPEALPALTAGIVHLWRVHLDAEPHCHHQLMQTLSLDERDRAERLQIPLKRQQFVVGRSHLRLILSRYLDQEPQHIQFEYTARGKPVLPRGYSHHAPCWFNLAHSGSVALIAIASQGRVGVDIEAIRPIRLKALAKRFLQPAEAEWLLALSPEQQQSAFFRLWVCKEAYLKATGEGLTGLHQVGITVKSDQPILHLPTSQHPWSLYELAIEPEFAAALAIEGERVSVCNVQFPEYFR